MKFLCFMSKTAEKELKFHVEASHYQDLKDFWLFFQMIVN